MMNSSKRAMKKQMSGFDIHFICREAQQLVGGFFYKAYQLAKDEVLLIFNVPVPQPSRSEGGKYNKVELFIKVGRFLCMERYMGSKPMKPTAFAMMLRKNLTNGRVTAVRQVGFDRIVEIAIEKGEDFRIVIEMFGDGNIVVLQEMTILQALKAQRWKDREVKAKREFVLPPAVNDPLTMTRGNLTEILQGSERKLVQALATEVNLGGPYAEELCRICGLEKSSKPKELHEDHLEGLWKALEGIKEQAAKEPENLVVLKDDVPIDVIPFKLGIYDGCALKVYDRFSKALVAFFSSTMAPAPQHIDTDKVQEQISRIERQMASQEEAVLRFISDIRENRAYADAIYTHFQDCERDLEALRNAQEELGWEEVSKRIQGSKYPASVDPSNGTLTLTFSDLDPKPLHVVLDIRKSASENANHYYERTKKAKEKLKGAREALEKSRNIIERLEAQRLKQKASPDAPEPTFSDPLLGADRAKSREFWFERFRWFLTSAGNLVCGGKDAKSNERLVKRHLQSADRYVHADIHGAPSIVVKASGPLDEPLEINEGSLQEACIFSVVYSRGWNAGVGWSSAYWVLPEQVSRTPPAGEFIPKGAFMIRGKRNHHQKLPMRVAIGTIEIDGVKKVMGGPEGSLDARAQAYVVLVPGDIKISDMAKEIASLLEVDPDEVQKVLPPGSCRIESTKGIGEKERE